MRWTFAKLQRRWEECQWACWLCPDLLPDAFLEKLGAGKFNVSGQIVMFLAKSEEEVAVFENIENGAKIPEWGQNEGYLARDAAEFFVESGRILDVLDGVRT